MFLDLDKVGQTLKWTLMTIPGGGYTTFTHALAHCKQHFSALHTPSTHTFGMDSNSKQEISSKMGHLYGKV